MEEGWLTEAELLRAVASEGSVSPRQLERWRLNDLVPRPTKVRWKQGRGFDSHYPPGSSAQLRALLWLRRFSDDTHNLRVALWIAGYAIPIEKLQESLFARLGRGLAPFLDDAPLERVAEPEDYAYELAEKMNEHSRGTDIGPVIRVRVPRKSARERALFAVCMLLLGGEGYADDDAVVGRFLGLPQISVNAGDNALEKLGKSGLLRASVINECLKQAHTDEIEAVKPFIVRGFELWTLALTVSGYSAERVYSSITKDAAPIAAVLAGMGIRLRASGVAYDERWLATDSGQPTTPG